MSKLFFTSDTHFGHGNIIKYCNRPFLTDADAKALEENGGTWDKSNWRISRDAVDMMNDDMTDNINRVVGENDTLWHLGDWAFASKERYAYKCEFYRNRIKCKNVNIIWGNHDHPKKIAHLFGESHFLHELRVPDQRAKIVLCHYAMAIWNKSHHGTWQLYGHSHTTAEDFMDRHFKHRKSIDVGVDNAYKILGEYRPFSLEELQGILMGRMGHSMDHHEKRSSKPTKSELRRGES